MGSDQNKFGEGHDIGQESRGLDSEREGRTPDTKQESAKQTNSTENKPNTGSQSSETDKFIPEQPILGQHHTEMESNSESMQQFEENEERNINLRRFAVIGIVIFLAALYFVWGTFLNFGTLIVRGEEPFYVFISEGKSQICGKNPCDITLPRGEKLISFYKKGYSAQSENVEVLLWDKVEVRQIFTLEPYLNEITTIPEIPSVPTLTKYSLKYDDAHHNWKVVKEGDKKETGLSYFEWKIENPLIFGSDEAVLVIERKPNQNQTIQQNTLTNTFYFVDLGSKQRNNIGQIDGDILSAKPSRDGRYFALSVETSVVTQSANQTTTREISQSTPQTEVQTGNQLETKTAPQQTQKSIFVVGNGGIFKYETLADFKNIFWNPANKLVSAYKDGKSWDFNLFDPETNTPKVLLKVDESDVGSPITSLFSSSKTNKIYLKAGEKAFEIIY